LGQGRALPTELFSQFIFYNQKTLFLKSLAKVVFRVRSFGARSCSGKELFSQMYRKDSSIL